MKKSSINLLIIFSTLISFSLISCDKDIENPTPENPTPEYFLKFDISGVHTEYTDPYGMFFIDFWNEMFEPTGMIFCANDYYDCIDFYLILPKDSIGLANFDITHKFVINGSNSMGLYNYPGSIDFQWSSDLANHDGMVEYNTSDTTNYFNKINSIVYINKTYSSDLNEWRCNYRVNGSFKMKVNNPQTGGSFDLTNGQYNMLIDVAAQ